MNKKGSILDIMYVMILLFVFAVSTIIAFTVWENYKGATNSSSNINLSTPTFDHVEGKMDIVMNNFDYIFAFIMTGLIIMLVVSTFFLKSHPAFFWITLLFLIIVLVIAGVLSNAFEEVGANENLQAGYDNFPIIKFVMEKLPTFMLFIGAIVIISLYAKSRQEGGEY